MKNELHPEAVPVAFQDVSSGRKFLTVSSIRLKGRKNRKTEVIDGVEYEVIIVDTTMDSHPAFTGEKRILDTAGRVEKFKSKFSRRKA